MDNYKNDDLLLQVPEDDALVPEITDTDMTPNPVDDITSEIIPDELNDTPLLNQGDATIGQFLGTLQSSVTTVWTYHLKTKKHFIHVELDSLYHTLLEKVDNLIEVYQGIICSIVPDEFVNTIYPTSQEPIAYLHELRAYIIGNREKLFSGYSEVISIIDDILNIIDTTIYKLTTFEEPQIKTFESFCYENYENEKDDE